ncbi:anaphase-promoting complex subunit 1 isoform X4 [Rhodamnia argentea]|uniref:Anaphase-promoting complex subunit 1 n=1 Tax=Rhodamnia argentea TaxID=178133 RepID=A0A8B8PJ85_9MYRT|nr:anaphase-promoting complex subunit 1 isoform X4 [Rhodamnia argentea]
MSPGVRHLNVLGEFKPFGLVAEALDGKPQDDSADKYDYFLFDSNVAREAGKSASTSGFGDHEIFIRGNRIIWTTGSRVYKRFTVASPVITACWCHLGDMGEALLCVLQADSLTVYNASGEVVTIPLPQSISSIWPLPFGLLLEQAAEGDFSHNIHFSSSILSSGACDTSHPRREIGHSPQSNFSCMSPFVNVLKGDTALLSSHLILKDPMEDPQFVYVEDRGKLTIMKGYNERTIWTSDQVPLMASYNKGKAQHSLWVAEVVNPTADEAMSSLPDVNPVGVQLKQFSFHRIWQGKGAHAAACKVFMAIDDDTTPIICFLLQGQKKLLSLRLQIYETNSDVLFDVKPDMSWSIPAVSAAPVVVTRPGVKVGLLPHTDIIVLAPENTLLLYSGKLCLCRYLLPSCLSRCRHLHNVEFSANVAVSHDVKIVGLADAVEGRVNIVISNGQMFRCALRQSPSSSLVKDCMEAMTEGMISSLYNHFLALLWGDNDVTYLSKANSSVDSEWVSFSSIMLQMCRRSTSISEKLPVSTCQSSWDFLVNSQFHQNYCKLSSFTGASSQDELESQAVECSRSVTEAKPTEDNIFYSELLVKSLDSLHAVYESLKLDNLRKLDLELLGVLLCKIAKFLGEECYLDHYVRDFPYLFNNLGMHNSSLSGRSPPNLFRWLENCLQHGFSSADTNDLPPLVCKEGSFAASRAKKIVSFYSLLFGAQQIGGNHPCGVCCNVAMGSYSTAEEHTVLAMVGEKFGLQQLDSLPPGVSLPLRHALDKCRESPPTDWPAAAYVLLGREDLALTRIEQPCKASVQEAQANENLIEMSTPYMLHLHPVTIPSVIFDSFGSENAKFEDADSTDGSVTDGMEHIFTSCIQLRYGRDLRLNEVRRLLSSARPVAIQTSVNPSASDQDLQQAQLWQLAQRTTALPIGRGAFTLATIHTLLTEAFTVPKLVLAGRLPAQQNATVNLDPNMRNIQELKSWPEFHNAVAAGLRLAPLQGKVSRTWIIYNKPKEPNAVHAGLLLALGLHGYLRDLSISDIYKYFSQDHESTTVGIMMGLAASYRGTMHPAISKVLYVHIPARHPSSFPELELPTLVQSAALMSVGLLFEGSAHPQTMQILLSEIGRRSGGDNVLEREGYAVSAGFSFGLVALGRGLDMLGFVETLLDRLFDYIGGKELHNERSYLLTPLTEEHNRGFGQMMDTAAFNVDVTAPGAIVALALMFLKTESEVILSRLSIPCTQFDLQYVRPDFIMLRVIARNMIMWSRVHPSKKWIESQVPEIVKIGVEGLREDVGNLMETDVEALVQAYINIVAGACISLGLKFAGTMDGNAQELLYEYAVYFLNEMKPVAATSGSNFPKGLADYVDRGTLEICLHLIVLSLSVVMAGSGHLQTLRLLKFLRGRNLADGHSNYGTQMTISLALGFLFLGGGMRTFSTSNSSIAALLITLYPSLPAGPNDNRCHLQAFRHLYVLATEARWIQTIDVDTGLPVYAPLEVTIKESENYSETSFCEITPCILPERSILKSVRVCGPRYWTQIINLVPEEKPWWTYGVKNDPFNSGTLYLKRKVGACSYVDDPIGCQSLLSRAMHKVFSMTNSRASSGDSAGNYISVDQLVSTFSSVPSLIAFAQLCRDPSWNSRYRPDVDFQEFCLQVLFECVSKDRPALLQVYLSLYTTMELMADLVMNNRDVLCDSVSVSSLKLALAYTQASLGGKLTNARGSVVQSIFIGSLRKRLEDLFKCSRHLRDDLHSYLKLGRWPADGSDGKRRSIILSWYLQWFGVPSPSAVEKAVKKVNAKSVSSSSLVPLLRLLLPSTHISALSEIGRLLCSS